MLVTMISSFSFVMKIWSVMRKFYLKKMTLIFDLEPGTRRCVSMRCAFIPNMSLVTKLYYSKFAKDHFFLVKYFCILRKLHKYFCVS